MRKHILKTVLFALLAAAFIGQAVASAQVPPRTYRREYPNYRPSPYSPYYPAPYNDNDGNGSWLPNTPYTVYSWCMSTPQLIDRILNGEFLGYYIATHPGSRRLAGPSLWRGYLVQAIESLKHRYPARATFNPLTYSVLDLALKLDQKFPHSMLGDQSATIVLRHMMTAAENVDQSFDQPTYLPACPDNCRGRWPGRGWGEMGPEFFVNYTSAARSVLDEFFNPAINGSGPIVLDAMAKDRWELNAADVTVHWLINILDSSIFRRNTFCLRQGLNALAWNLNNYLNTPEARNPYGDMAMRSYVRDRMNDAQNVLDNYDGNSCNNN